MGSKVEVLCAEDTDAHEGENEQWVDAIVTRVEKLATGWKVIVCDPTDDESMWYKLPDDEAKIRQKEEKNDEEEGRRNMVCL